LTIDFQQIKSNNSALEIIGSNGVQTFKSNISEKKLIFDVEKYSPGLYLIRLKTDDLIYLGKFCKY